LPYFYSYGLFEENQEGLLQEITLAETESVDNAEYTRRESSISKQKLEELSPVQLLSTTRKFDRDVDDGSFKKLVDTSLDSA